MTIQTLEARQREIGREARAKYREITDDMPESEARKIEKEFDLMMIEYDELRDQVADARAAQDIISAKRPNADTLTVPASGDISLVIDDEEVRTLRPEARMADWARDETQDREQLSPGKYLRAMVLGAKTDPERRALAEGSDAAGGYTVPTVTSSAMIDLVRANSVLMAAGSNTLPLTTDDTIIAKVASDPVPAWRNENAAVTESDPTFGRVRLQPKSLAVMVKASVELMEDSLNMEAELPRIMGRALAVEMDRVGLIGTGVAPEPLGITNYSGLTANTFGGGALTSYSPLVQARTALHEANERLNGFVMSARDEGAFADLTATDNQPLRKPEAIANTPMLWTTNMPTDGGGGSNESSIIAGDWSQLIVGMRSEIRIVPLRERFMTELQFGFIAHMRVDFAATREGAFTVLTGITP